jgi:predicted AlkP superfamily pyrophosphatase or phosphodiesterase
MRNPRVPPPSVLCLDTLRRLRSRTAVLAAIVLLSLAAGCGGPRYVIAPPEPRPAPSPDRSPVSEHVVLVSIDGLRPDAIAAFGARTLQRLMAEGSYSLTARTIVPSKTLPSHTSMLSGRPPGEHGVSWNNVRESPGGDFELPTVFSRVRAEGYVTAAFFSKAKFGYLQRPGTLDYSQSPGGWWGRWLSDRTAGDVERYLQRARPHLLFVHLADPDAAGHRHGWMSPQYGRGVIAADAAVARLMTSFDQAFGAGRYTLLVTSDHGGHGKDHGSDDPRDTTIPWIAWGRGVAPGQLPDWSVSTMDTAATVVWLLGLRENAEWTGHAVTGAFHAP